MSNKKKNRDKLKQNSLRFHRGKLLQERMYNNSLHFFP